MAYEKSRRTYNGVHLNKKSNTQDVVEQSLTKILNQEHFENVKRYAESIGDTSLQKCLERLKSWEENPDCPSEISLYYDHAPYSFGFTQCYPDGRTGIVGGLLYHGIPDRSFAVTLQPFHGWQIHT